MQKHEGEHYNTSECVRLQMENTSLSLSETQTMQTHSQLIQSINSSRNLENSSAAPKISEDSQVLLLSMLDCRQLSGESLPPEVEIPEFQQKQRKLVFLNDSNICRLRFFWERWRIVFVLRKVKLACVGKVFNVWRQATEDSYVSDVAAIMQQRRLQLAFERWRGGLRATYLLKAESVAEQRYSKNLLGKAFAYVVARYNALQIALFRVEMGFKHRILTWFMLGYQISRFLRHQRNRLQFEAYTELNRAFKASALARRSTLRIALVALTNQFQQRAIARGSVTAAKTAQKLYFAVAHYPSGIFTQENQECSNDSGVLREEAEYFVNCNRRFVMGKTREYLDAALDGASAKQFEKPENAQKSAQVLESSNQNVKSVQLATTSVSELETRQQPVQPQCLGDESDDEHDLGQLAKLAQPTTQNAFAVQIDQNQIAQYRQEIARMRQLESFIRTQPPNTQFRAPIQRDSRDITTFTCVDSAKQTDSSTARFFAVSGAVRARNLLRQAFQAYYLLTMQKAAYKAKCAVGTLFFRHRRQEIVFQAMRKRFVEIEAKRMVILRAQLVCVRCQKQFFFKLWQSWTRETVLSNLKARYIQRNRQYRILSNCFVALYNKYDAAAHPGYSFVVFRKRCNSLLTERAFMRMRQRYQYLMKIAQNAQIFCDNRRLQSVFYIFHLLLLKRTSHSFANDAFAFLVDQAWVKCENRPPGSWYDDSFPMVRLAFQSMRRKAGYCIVLRQIQAKLDVLNRRRLSLGAFYSMRQARIAIDFECIVFQRCKALAFCSWRRAAQFRLKIQLAGQRLARVQAKLVLTLWRREIWATEFLQLRLSKCAFRALLQRFQDRKRLNQLHSKLCARYSQFLRYKALFAMLTTQQQTLEQAKLLASPAFQFAKCLRFDKYQRNFVLNVGAITVTKYTAALPQFGYKLVFLKPSKPKAHSPDVAYQAIRAQLRSRMLQSSQSSARQLTLSQLDQKMENIQTRIARLQQ